jgi:NAD(P)-dependent dehydrogenase (short-subunit alcohol dehydrogenase family)
MVASRAAFRGETDCPDYAVSKAGMVNLARCLARAEGPNGVTANSVCPGWVETDMAAADLAVRRAEIEAEIPLGRVATPEDVANAVLWFLSPLGAYANGTAVALNGGSFLH